MDSTAAQRTPAPPATILLLMGVSGSGKTTIGILLSQRIGWPFLDGDDFHPQKNKDKMAAGIALTDEDRWPWLDAIHANMQELLESGQSAIFACSALKAAYRDRLRAGFLPQQVRIAFLHASQQELAEHLAHRNHPFMNPTLLSSQLATLEDPGTDAWTVMTTGTAEQAAEEIESRLRAVGSLGPS